jgi:hypothetical protein
MNGKIFTPYIAMGDVCDVTEKTIRSVEGKKFSAIQEVRDATWHTVRVFSVADFVEMLNDYRTTGLNHFWYATVWISC